MGEILIAYGRNRGARVGIAGAAIVVIALIVGGYLLFASTNHVLPDVTPSTKPSAGGGGGVDRATSYAEIKARVTMTTGQCILVVCAVTLASGGFALSVHEVLAPATAPATIFQSPLTFGEDCHGRAVMAYTTPDYSGKAESAEASFALDQPMILRWGNMNMYSKGAISLSFDLQVKGCGQYADWVKVGNTISAGSFQFDGVDNFTF